MRSYAFLSSLLLLTLAVPATVSAHHLDPVLPCVGKVLSYPIGACTYHDPEDGVCAFAWEWQMRLWVDARACGDAREDAAACALVDASVWFIVLHRGETHQVCTPVLP